MGWSTRITGRLFYWGLKTNNVRCIFIRVKQTHTTSTCITSNHGTDRIQAAKTGRGPQSAWRQGVSVKNKKLDIKTNKCGHQQPYRISHHKEEKPNQIYIHIYIYISSVCVQKNKNKDGWDVAVFIWLLNIFFADSN